MNLTAIRELCPTGKLPYFKERQANRAITKALERGETGQLRHYKCPHCEWWHLSKKRER